MPNDDFPAAAWSQRSSSGSASLFVSRMNVPILFRLSERGKYEDRLLDEEVVIPADENLSEPSIPEDRALENLAATESAQRT